MTSINCVNALAMSNATELILGCHKQQKKSNHGYVGWSFSDDFFYFCSCILYCWFVQIWSTINKLPSNLRCLSVAQFWKTCIQTKLYVNQCLIVNIDFMDEAKCLHTPSVDFLRHGLERTWKYRENTFTALEASKSWCEYGANVP